MHAVKVDLFIGADPERHEGGHEVASRLLPGRPDVSLELSPAMGHALGDGVRQILGAAEGMLPAMGPQVAALADALAQITQPARGAHGDEVPFVVIIAGRPGSSADDSAAVGNGAGT